MNSAACRLDEKEAEANSSDELLATSEFAFEDELFDSFARDLNTFERDSNNTEAT